MVDAIVTNGVLVKYTGNQQSVEIPEGITSIAEKAFWGCHSIVRITIPASLVHIEKNAFGCAALTELHIDDLAAWCNTDIACDLPREWKLYHKGQQITHLEIPDGVPAIRKNVFSWCSLKHLSVPESVTHIGSSAFHLCRYIRSVELPATLRRIGAYAFADCYDLESVSLPETAKTLINGSAFNNCRRLTKRPVQWGNPYYQDRSFLTLCGPALADYETKQGEHLCYMYYDDESHARILAQAEAWRISYQSSESYYDGNYDTGHDDSGAGMMQIPPRFIVVENGNFAGVTFFENSSHYQVPLPKVEAVAWIKDWQGENMPCGGCSRSYEDGLLEHSVSKEYHLCKKDAE